MKINAIYFLLSFILTAILGKILLPILRKMKIGQNERLDGPRSHLRKQGTPTMGGIMIILSMVIVGMCFCFINKSYEILPVLLASFGFGLVGFVDDFKKLVFKNTEGLNPKLKMLGLSLISIAYTVFLIKYVNIGTEIIIPFINYNLALPIWIYIPFVVLQGQYNMKSQ